MVAGPSDLKVGDTVEYTGEIAATIETGGAYASIGRVRKNTIRENKNAWVIVSKNPESNQFSKAGKGETTYGILLTGTARCAKLKGSGRTGDYLVATEDGRLEVNNNAPRGCIIAQLIVDAAENDKKELKDIMGLRM